jgi:hypothetical protein
LQWQICASYDAFEGKIDDKSKSDRRKICMKFFSIRLIASLIFLPAITFAGVYLPIVKLDNSQNAVAVWESSENGFTVVKSAVKSGSGNWKSPVKISLGNQQCLNASIEMNYSNGNVAALWVGYNDTWHVYSLYGAMLQSGKDWTQPKQISNSSENVSTFSTCINDKGSIMVSWVSSDNANNTNFYSSSASIDKYNSWSSPSTIPAP